MTPLQSVRFQPTPGAAELVAGGGHRWRWLLAAALLMTIPAAWPACTATAIGVNFGSYNPLDPQSLDSTGSVEVICDVATGYAISLSSGRRAYAARAMGNGVSELFYNLYIDVARTTVWGDGTTGTATLSATGTGELHAVYGNIPAQQNVVSGNFSDTIVVTLTF